MKTRNKIIAILLVCVIIISSAVATAVSAADDDTLKIKFVPQSSAKAGETVMVDVYFTGENIKAIMFPLIYDEDVLEILVGDEDNSYWEADTKELNRQMVMSAMIDETNGNIAPAVAFDKPVTLNNNKLLQLEFLVKASTFAPGQSVNVSVGEVAFATKNPLDPSADEVKFNSTDNPSLVVVEQGTVKAYCDHAWDNGVVTVEPTDTTEGVKTYTCTLCGETKTETINKIVLAGDLDKNGVVDNDDLVYLLYYTYFPDSFTVDQDCDFDKSGEVDNDDLVYLLYYTYFPDLFPIG